MVIKREVESPRPRRIVAGDGAPGDGPQYTSICARILAENLYLLLRDNEWFTKERQFKFCSCLLQNLTDGSIEAALDNQRIEAIRRIPLAEAIQSLAEGDPESGLPFLVALICRELRERQHLNMEEQWVFYNTLFEKFFPRNDARLC